MAEGDDSIKYSDLVTPDDSIKNLISQLEQLNKGYGDMVAAIKAGAESTVKAIKGLSASTKEGKKELDDAAIYASRLEKAHKELKFAMSDTGKEVAWLKNQTATYNKMTVEQRQQAQSLVGSYNKLKLELKEQVTLWKSLSEQERQNEAIGQQTLDNIIDIKTRLKSLDNELRVQVDSITRVQKAEKELAYLRSEEGQRLITLKQQIAEEYAQRRREANAIDDVSRAEMKLAAVQDNNFYLLQKLNLQIKEETRMQKLRAQLNSSAEGSYNRLAAQYEINKIKLNAMSEAERKGTQAGRELEEETRNIYATMIKLQEATGNYRLSVGNYKTAWNGLGVAVNQVVRELPAAAVGINTFFLGISNNIPILVDEINKLRAANKLAIQEGKPAKSVIGSITASLFSWQTALVVVLTVLSMHGKAIIEWVSNLVKGKRAVISMSEALDNIQAELKDTNAEYGNNLTTYKKLQQEWSKLNTLKEQKQWIKDNATEFGKLGVSIKTVSEAEQYLVNMTDNVILAMQLRAKAAAAMKLASEKYEESLIKQNEAETRQYTYEKDPKTGRITKVAKDLEKTATVWEKITAKFWGRTKTDRYGNVLTDIAGTVRDNIKDLENEAKTLEKEGDQYASIFEDLNNQANALLGKFQRKHKTDKTRTPRERDLTDVIYRNDIELRKKYEASITALQNDEYAKRRKELMDAVMHENNQLKEKYRKNEAYLADYNNKYKELTDEQVKMIQEQQEMIKKTLINNGLKLSLQLEQVEKDRRIKQLEINRNYDDLNLDETIASLEEERKLQIQYLSREFELTADTNRRLRKEGDDSARSEEEIRREFYNKQIAMIELYNQKILELKQGNIDLQLEIVKKGSQEELNLLLKKNELERQMALSQNRAKPASQRQSEEAINKSFDKKGAQITGSFTMAGISDAQAQAEAEFNIVRRSEYQITKFKLEQERERWMQQIKLAKEGALDWSDAQIAAAEATVKGIDRQLDELGDITGMIGEKGLGGALLTKLGLDDKQINALGKATDIFLEQIQAIVDAEVELAEIQVEKARERVEAAKSAYDAEVEARNNGYANNVATAKKELQQEKKRQAEKEKLLLQAQRRQEAINTVMQASNLITATALIWAQLGFPWALPAIAAMWGSFAVAKIKAAQVTRAQSQEYGEGGLEFLEGGSHASGSDIDLQTKNSKGKNMRAEGGEAMAIINKRSTRRYKKQLPGIIEALNKGTFNEKYIKAFDKGETLQAQIVVANQGVDLSKLERDIEEIKKQGASRIYAGADGSMIEIKGNVKRIYR